MRLDTLTANAARWGQLALGGIALATRKSVV